jgi:hypothetical protein
MKIGLAVWSEKAYKKKVESIFREVTLAYVSLVGPTQPTSSYNFGTFDDSTGVLNCAKCHVDWSRDFSLGGTL